jgi:type IV pilus assembly protein PilA
MTRRWGSAGFTIIELLIVIVVIAVLAAITIVAYNGIQQRAKTAVIANAVQVWEQAITRAGIEGFNFTDYGTTCLGSATDFPSTNSFPAGVCAASGTVNINHNETLLSNWPSKVPRPNGLLPVTTLKSSGSALDLRSRGIWVDVDPNARLAQLSWIPQNVGQCGSGASLADGDSSLQGSYCYKQIFY